MSATKLAKKPAKIKIKKPAKAKLPPPPYFEVYPDAKGEYRWRLKSKNGRIVADSGEGYATRNKASRAAHNLWGIARTAHYRTIVVIHVDGVIVTATVKGK